jgi:MoaA/NifB/PqqE/SkfB family radical SAM enzyme
MGYLDYLKYVRRAFYKQGTTPLYLVFFVTTKCNARCKHCLLGNQAVATTNDLTIDEIEKVSASMDEMLFLLPTGGEPFLRKDLSEIVRIFYKNNKIKNAVIPSNGGLTQRVLDTATKILKTCPGLDLGIDISIDALGDRHDELRQVPGLFDKAVTTFKELRKLEKHHERLNVNVESTVSSFNQDHLPELYNFLVNELKVSTVFTLLTRGKPKDPAAKHFDIQKYQDYAQILENDIKHQVLTGYYNFPFCDVINAKRIVRNRLIAKLVKEGKYQIPCYAGSLGGAMFSNGDILPCELLTDRKLGNVRDNDYNFKAIWFNEKADEARKFIKDTKCFCTYECFLTVNILFNPRMWPQVFKEWASLKISKHKPHSVTRKVSQAGSDADLPLS